MICDECGFVGESDGDSCLDRWHTLLALDHSRQPPWGALHGVAFASWTLQHSRTSNARAVERAWGAMHKLFIDQLPHDELFRSLRAAHGEEPPGWGSYPMPKITPPRFPISIASLGDFVADEYVPRLWKWARATFNEWRSANGLQLV